jgi:hypothetical protein
MDYVDVHYLDAIGVGSGMQRLHLSNLRQWLADRPGYLIYRITAA